MCSLLRRAGQLRHKNTRGDEGRRRVTARLRITLCIRILRIRALTEWARAAEPCSVVYSNALSIVRQLACLSIACSEMNFARN